MISFIIQLASYPVLRFHGFFRSASLYHLHDVECTGNEGSLNECRHNGAYVDDCDEEAGVACNCKLSICSYV